jgi:glycosyltransferase involved in cell wall biosynthesis
MTTQPSHDASAKAGASLSHQYSDLKALVQGEFGAVDRLYITPHLKEAGLNPYLPLLYAPFKDDKDVLQPLNSSEFLRPFLRRLFLRENSIWHQHWLQFSSVPTWIRTQFRLLASLLFLLAGGRVLWTVHNPRPHVNRFVGLNLWYCRLMAHLTTRFHVHNQEAVKAVDELYGYPGTKVAVLAHPHFPVRPVPKSEARAGLRAKYGVETEGRKVFIMFGFIASFKGIREVAALFKDVDPSKGLLIIAGQPRGNEPEYAASLRSDYAFPAVALFDRSIPEEDVNLFMCAADFAVFNQSYALNSSGMTLADDYGCHIIAPDLEATSILDAKSMSKFRTPAELAELIRARLSA